MSKFYPTEIIKKIVDALEDTGFYIVDYSIFNQPLENKETINLELIRIDDSGEEDG